MSDTFNPYQQWLGLDAQLVDPNHYELLSVERFEADLEQLSLAADRAIAKVRGFRPGSQAAQWAALLDRISTAKACLLDPAGKSAYDQSLQLNHGSSRALDAPGSYGSFGAPQIPSPPLPDGFDDPPPAAVPQPQAAPTFQPQTFSSPAAPYAPSAYPAPNYTMPAARPAPFSAPTPAPPQPAAPQPYTAPAAAYNPQAPIAFAASPSISDPMAPTYGAMPSYAAPPSFGSPAGYAAPSAMPSPLASTLASPPAYGTTYEAAAYGTPAYSPLGYAAAPAPTYPAAVPGPVEPYAAPAYGIPSGVAVPQSPAVPLGYVPPPPAPSGPDPMAPLGASPAPGNYSAAPAPYGATAAESSAPPVTRATSRMAQAKAKSSAHLPLLAAGVAGGFLLLCLGLFLGFGGLGKEKKSSEGKHVALKEKHSKTHTPPGDHEVSLKPTPKPDPKPEVKPEAMPEPRPEPKPVPEVKPEPTPEPTPKPETKPEPKPEPTPDPKPDPEPKPEPKPEAKPEVKATPQELAALGKHLKTALAALSERNLDEAEAELKKAEPLAKAEEHMAKVERLKSLAHYVREFWKSVDDGRKGLEGGSDLQIGSSVISIVEPGPDKFIIKVKGEVRRYTPRDIPDGIAVVLAKRFLNEGDATSKLVLGSIYAVSKNTDKKADARRNWEEAQAGGAELGDLMMVLDDTYDFDAESPDSP